MTDELVVERDEAVLLARINRPEARNALNGTVMQGLAEVVRTAENDPGIRALVLAGTGERAFCAGMDLRDFADGAETQVPDDFMRLMHGDVTVPLLGAVNGFAVGGGCELALACDLLVASEQASFGLPEVSRGLFPGVGLLHITARLPLGVALELALTGQRISAVRAHELGFVNRVVASADVLATTLDLARTVAANAPLSLTAIKEVARLAAAGAPSAADRMAEWQQVIFTSEDAKEGALAFVEKREPVWQGR
jgi:enoyl-CoA hydratase/carnithine racemase